MSTHLVIGRGEVGHAVACLLAERFDVDSLDKGEGLPARRYQFIHVCFPWGLQFYRQVLDYLGALADPNGCICVIHSTVPLGTTRGIQQDTQVPLVHSPVRGKHPNLLESLKRFVKFFGGVCAPQAAGPFEDCGVACYYQANTNDTEALKLWDTTIYGLNIVLEKAIWEYCRQHGLDYNVVYRMANITYNDGYCQMDHPEFSKYVLRHQDGPIGGHCVVPNARLLQHWIGDLIVRMNEQYQREAKNE